MKRVIAIVLGIALCASAAQAAGYTAKQAMECYPDAVQFCGAPRAVGAWKKLSGGEHARIIACMIFHASQLSSRCLKAFGR